MNENGISRTQEMRRLAIFFDASAVSIIEAFENARDLCRILWIVGWSKDGTSQRTLSRFGEVVDVNGMTQDEAVSHIVTSAPDGVVVFNDAPITLAALVASKLDLPFHTPHAARLLTDKLAQRVALRDAGLPVPVFASVRLTETEVSVPFPAVLKPRSGAGSRNTYRVENLEQVRALLRDHSSSDQFILEEWLMDQRTEHRLSSDIVSVESVVHRGQIDHVMVTGRFPFAPPFRETGSFVPSDLAPALYDEVCNLASAAVNALDIRVGIVHTEIKVTPSGPRVIEVNGRLGGGIGALVSRIGGPRLKVVAMRLALGMDIEPILAFDASRVAYFRWIVPPVWATRFVNVTGVEALQNSPGVDEIHINLHPGQAVDFRHGSWSGHALQVDGTVSSHSELLRLVGETIPSTIQITWDGE